MNKTYNICLLGGDGIGPEVVNQTVRVLNATGLKFEYSSGDIGFSSYEKNGTPLPEDTLTKVKAADATLFGAVTTPPNIKGYFSPIVRLRKTLHLYANVRPCFSLPVADMRQDVDLIIVRENTEDLYSGQERLIEGGAITERVITRAASERIVRYAFELATLKGRKKVTAVHKANVMRLTDGLFLEVAQSVAKDYPAVVFEEQLVDSCAMRLVHNPQDFDVIVTTNMFGDILSDLCAAHVGGLGIVPSGNIGDKVGVFEPVHGSAPKYTGMNKVNPTATIFASSMMLEFFGEIELSKKVKQAVLKTIKEKNVTYDLGGSLSTSEFTDKVIHNLH